MLYKDLDTFISQGKDVLRKGPICLILVEDLVEVASTIEHHIAAGFETVIVFAPAQLSLPDRLEDQIHRIPYNMLADGATERAVNAIIAAAPDMWVYYCYNAEYLFTPFAETRSVAEMLAFHSEERRSAMLSYVIDLYAGDLDAAPNAVSIEDAHIDKTGYYALSRKDPENDYAPKTRQLDFFGGLRWRFEEHISFGRRRIDRISLFKAKPGLKLKADHTFNDEEYNTHSCEWHNNMTAAICSFRTAKALKSNPGSKFDIHSFKWHNSVRFDWKSQQLMDFGLMEPGQWF